MFDVVRWTPPSFKKLIESGGAVVVEIRRGMSQLRTAVIDAKSLPHDTLRMTVSKEDDKLQLAVGDLTLEFIDESATTSRPRRAKFAVCWPAGTRSLSLKGSQRQPQETPSFLRQGDSAYAAGQYREALEAYEKQAKTPPCRGPSPASALQESPLPVGTPSGQRCRGDSEKVVS